ncbi:MAG: hypothetical protein EZS28_007081 [Streblomastix strix]|uniref:Uncharacterized protein n=1 Tax=Streblomastix strix TaxID=222440 RepID=A0A5J4WQN9_9EUKA|nr:MAG: hypothetical protein EZS28_007081 [Streblomastix strix]
MTAAAGGGRADLKEFELVYQFATNISLEYNATDSEIFKIFETLIENYTLREEEKQEYQKFKNHYTFTESLSEKTINVINYLHYLNKMLNFEENARRRANINPDPDSQEPECNN